MGDLWIEKKIGDEWPVLNHGFVRLDNSMADDLSVVNAARVSFAKRHDIMDESDRGLISYLMKSGHGTPFEHNAFRFHVKCPIFIAREWMRHRIGSFNEWSARYSKLEPEFYIPEGANIRKRVGKPGHYTYEPAYGGDAVNFRSNLADKVEAAYDAYENALAAEIAPELARLFLPVNIYTQFYWTVNARALMNFLHLRNASTAQWEIQEYARAVEGHFERVMPITWGAFQLTRVAP